jgi:hypothetical protein
MKTILRILLILVAAVIVGGITLALVNSSGSTASLAQTRGGFGERHIAASGDFVPGQAPTGANGNFRPDRGGRLEGGAFSWAEMLKNVVIVAVLIAVVALLERLLKAARLPKLARVTVRSSEVERKE